MNPEREKPRPAEVTRSMVLTPIFPFEGGKVRRRSSPGGDRFRDYA